MKAIFLSLLFLALPLTASAQSLSENDLVGPFSLIGNGGFLLYSLVFKNDGSANLTQQLADGSMDCLGVFKFDVKTADLTAVFNCPAGDVISQEVSLAGITSDDLRKGAKVNVHIKSSLGSDSMVSMELKGL